MPIHKREISHLIAAVLVILAAASPGFAEVHVVEGDTREIDGTIYRIIGPCHVGEYDLAHIMVADGMAWAYRRYSMDYTPKEDLARSNGIGVRERPNPAAGRSGHLPVHPRRRHSALGWKSPVAYERKVA